MITLLKANQLYFQFIGWITASVITTTVFIYSTFETKSAAAEKISVQEKSLDKIDKRLDRIEDKLDQFLVKQRHL